MKELNRYCLGDDGLEVSADGPWVLYADAQAALAEKDAEIERLRSDLLKTTRNLANELESLCAVKSRLAEAERTIERLKDVFPFVMTLADERHLNDNDIAYIMQGVYKRRDAALSAEANEKKPDDDYDDNWFHDSDMEAR